ncbi:conserved hypothetical protein [Ricinus communis]|uniref:Uncharacterized protein n=1 Tax=Ricinus communis TaxID=3988 RepID=B9TB16_RICCO|nr:conserved hypothetical protein [Ricinus communis]
MGLTLLKMFFIHCEKFLQPFPFLLALPALSLPSRGEALGPDLADLSPSGAFLSSIKPRSPDPPPLADLAPDSSLCL